MLYHHLMKNILTILTLSLSSFFIYSQEYQLMWEDHFNQPVLNEKNHWTIEVNGNGGGNNELQYYRRENISIEKHPDGDSCLVISAKRENYLNKVATSGRLVTRNKVSTKYGKIEARIQLPETANGLWPAFWMMGEDITTRGWPRCGEIDILEMGNTTGINNGTQDRYFNGACHWGESWAYYAKASTSLYSLQDDFHLYTMTWNKEGIKMYLDQDKFPNVAPYFEMSLVGDSVAGNKTYYFNKPFHILFNLAVGGNFTGITGNSNIGKITALPADGTPVKMYVDYVRIYQKGDVGQEFHLATATGIFNPESQDKTFAKQLKINRLSEKTFNLSYPDESIQHISLHSFIGQTMLQIDVNENTTVLNAQKVPTGNYILSVNLSSGKTAHKKILIY